MLVEDAGRGLTYSNLMAFIGSVLLQSNGVINSCA